MFLWRSLQLATEFQILIPRSGRADAYQKRPVRPVPFVRTEFLRARRVHRPGILWDSSVSETRYLPVGRVLPPQFAQAFPSRSAGRSRTPSLPPASARSGSRPAPCSPLPPPPHVFRANPRLVPPRVGTHKRATD